MPKKASTSVAKASKGDVVVGRADSGAAESEKWISTHGEDAAEHIKVSFALAFLSYRNFVFRVYVSKIELLNTGC
eukprot:m.647599 g.647599  ORF g.647599 m.647599 type:complete len:75 (+) comp22658_c2_seq4:220-444(+)